MNYLLLIAETQADLDRRTDPVRAPALGEAWKAYSEALRKAGVFVRGAGLQPPQTGRERAGKLRMNANGYQNLCDSRPFVVYIHPAWGH